MRPSGQVVGAAPDAQVTVHPAPSQRHFALARQLTVQVPEHFTPHSDWLSQVTVLPAPRVPSQSAELEHVTFVFAPPFTSQRALSLHATTPFCPTVPAQVELSAQLTEACSAPATVQVAFEEQLVAQAALVQVCVHEPLVHPQAVLVQAHPAPWQTGTVEPPQPARERVNTRNPRAGDIR
ncbi:MAG: hypothetical protein JNJ54_29650 [Myxococcaceae bacterium]|nr:hypothetical protein [Myxococcaceae bacterium]